MSGLRWTFELDQNSKAERADKTLFQLLSSHQGKWDGEKPSQFSRNQIQKWIEEGRVTVNQKLLKQPNTTLKGPYTVEILLPQPSAIELEPEDREIDILFQDKHIVVVNKPPGLTVHPSATQKKNTLVHALLHHIKDLSGIGGKLRPGIVHRIDKDTSGVLLITKTDQAHLKMTEVFSKHEIDRTYWALCYGTPDWNTKTIETTIARNPNDRKKMAVNVKNGKKAITHLKTIKKFGDYASHIEATLETGRTHQVRVHLTHLQLSLLGDPTYGKPTSQQQKWKKLPFDIQTCVSQLPGQALHARTLGFHHPVSGEYLKFTAEPFKEFQTLLDTLQKSD